MIHLNDLSNSVDITVCSCKQSPFCGRALSKACYFTREHVKQQDCATLQADNNLISASQRRKSVKMTYVYGSFEEMKCGLLSPRAVKLKD